MSIEEEQTPEQEQGENPEQTRVNEEPAVTNQRGLGEIPAVAIKVLTNQWASTNTCPRMAG